MCKISYNRTYAVARLHAFGRAVLFFFCGSFFAPQGEKRPTEMVRYLAAAGYQPRSNGKHLAAAGEKSLLEGHRVSPVNNRTYEERSRRAAQAHTTERTASRRQRSEGS